MFKMKSKIVDERIVNIQNKVYKEAYYVVMTICLVSIIIKFCLHGVNVESALPEFLAIVISGIYFSVRTVRLGLYKDEVEIHDRSSKIPMNVKNVIIGLVSGAVIAVYFGLRSAILFGNNNNRLWYFILVFAASLMIYIPFFVSIVVIGDVIARKASPKSSPEDKE